MNTNVAILSVRANSDNDKIELMLSYGNGHWLGQSSENRADIRAYCCSKKIESIIIEGEKEEANRDERKESYHRFLEWAEKLTTMLCDCEIQKKLFELGKPENKIFLKIIFEDRDLAVIPVEILYWDEKFLSERFIIGRTFKDAKSGSKLGIEKFPFEATIVINVGEKADKIIEKAAEGVKGVWENLEKNFGKNLVRKREDHPENNRSPKDIISKKLTNSNLLVYFGHCDRDNGWQLYSGNSYFSESDIDVLSIYPDLPYLIFSYACQSIGLAKAFGKHGVRYYMGTFWPTYASNKGTEFLDEFLNSLFMEIFSGKSVAEIFWQVVNKQENGRFYYPFIGRNYGIYCEPSSPLLEIPDYWNDFIPFLLFLNPSSLDNKFGMVKEYEQYKNKSQIPGKKEIDNNKLEEERRKIYTDSLPNMISQVRDISGSTSLLKKYISNPKILKRFESDLACKLVDNMASARKKTNTPTKKDVTSTVYDTAKKYISDPKNLNRFTSELAHQLAYNTISAGVKLTGGNKLFEEILLKHIEKESSDSPSNKTGSIRISDINGKFTRKDRIKMVKLLLKNDVASVLTFIMSKIKNES